MKRSRFLAIAILSGAMTLSAAAQKNNSKTPPPSGNVPAGTSTATKSTGQAATTDPTYVIGPSDELSINVWGEPDMSRVVPVRPDGMISIPLINDVQAAGKTPMQLAAAISEKLVSGSLVKDPQVTVTVTAINSQRVFILGNVARAGAYPLVPGMTVLQAISSAGGLGQFAKQTQIYILRTENGKSTRFPFNYKLVLRGQNPAQDIVLKPGDTIVVP